MSQLQTNTLFYGDNLEILREYIPDESVDLIYLDPPFNSQRTYNVLFKYESGEDSEAQIAAFDDTWHWNVTAEETFFELVTQAPDRVSKMIAALREFIGPSQMLAYLVMMAARLVELHRVLKSTGSLYLHCDPTASHYLKIILDTIFGPAHFKNEIIWDYQGWTHQKMGHFPRKHDILLFYTKSEDSTFNPQSIPWTREEYIKKRKQKIHVDADGREYIYDKRGGAGKHRYLDIALAEGRPVSSVWSDISVLTSSANERLGYPTQKPISLLERIIEASSNPGDIVLDPFCGCGTTVAAAQKLGRRWIGIDITHLSIALMKYRLEEMFPDIDFQTLGEPESVGAARYLAEHDRFQFEWWALSLIKARPSGGQKGSKKGKKGADRGIDGVITFVDEQKGKPKRILVQVKSGKVSSRDIRDLVGTVKREKAAIGVFITLEAPTRDMQTEAVSAGFYHSPGWNQKFPKIQILTIEQLLSGDEVKMPPTGITFKQAQRIRENQPTQKGLFE